VVAVPVRVMLKAPLVARVEPSARVRVAAVAGAVTVTLLRLVAEATPRVGVVRDGLVLNTRLPVPVSSVTAANRFELLGVAKKVATPFPRPAIPVDTGRPVALVRLAKDGVPMFGVVRTGLVANTRAPEPVSSETTPASWAEVVAP
jgi:hypothetical protein